MEATNKRRENLSWPDQNQVNAQLEAIRELAKELRTDYLSKFALTDKFINYHAE